MARRRRVGRPRATGAHAREIFVKVAKTGGVVTETCLNGDRTVETALESAGFDYNDNDKFRVNGVKASLSTLLKNHDIVTMAGKIEGGQV